MGIVGEERDLGRVVELALACRDRRGFREQLLDLLEGAVGFDKGSVQSFREGVGSDTCARGYERIAAFEHLPHYMNEFEPQEIAAASQGKPIIDIEALSAGRRDRLSLYHQFLRPEKVTVFVTVMWRDEHGVAGVSLARTGCGARFAASELRTIERLLPAIRLGDTFVSLQQRESASPPFEAWADDVSLSAKEREVTALVVRGLANGEIAALLGVSPNTVRNQLASVFRKAEVSTRSELVFVATTFVPSRAGVVEKPRWLTHIR